MGALVTVGEFLPAELVEQVSDFRKASKADNTKRAYRAAWQDFALWCDERGLSSLPASPETVAAFLADRAHNARDEKRSRDKGLTVAALRLRVAAIGAAHKKVGLPFDARTPVISETLSGITRTKGAAAVKKDALVKDKLRDAVRAYASDGSLKALRDRALLVIGFYAALRRSELVAIDVEHVKVTDEGLILTIPFRKTDQAGVGTEIGLPAKDDAVTCPVKAFRDYVAAAGITEGALFRSVARRNYGSATVAARLSDRDVARIVKAAAKAAGEDGDLFGAHSLRSGFITSAARAGVTERVIAKQSGHKSIDVLRGYVRSAGLFTENAAALI